MILGVPRWYFWLSAALTVVLAASVVAVFGPSSQAHPAVLPYTITWQRDALKWNGRTLPCASSQSGELAVAQSPGWTTWNASKVTWTPGTYFAVRCQRDGTGWAWKEAS